MEASATSSQLALLDLLSPITASSESDSHKAWHLLSLLLSIGHPTPPLDLASLCTLFPATADLVLALCSIPNSPISLTYDTGSNNEGSSSSPLLVTVSLLGLFAIWRFASNFNLDAFLPRIGTGVDGTFLSFQDLVRTYFRKRKRIRFDPENENEIGEAVFPPLKRSSDSCRKVDFHLTEEISREINCKERNMLFKLNNITLTPNLLVVPNLFVKIIGENFRSRVEDIGHIENEGNEIMIADLKEHKGIVQFATDEESASPSRILDNQPGSQDAQVDEVDLKNRRNVEDKFFIEYDKRRSPCPVDFDYKYNNNTEESCAKNVGIASNADGLLPYSCKMERKAKKVLFPMNGSTLDEQLPERSVRKRIDEMPSLEKHIITGQTSNQAVFPTTNSSVAWKQLSKSSAKLKASCRNEIASREQVKESSPLKENYQGKKDHKEICMEQKLKVKCDNVQVKEGKKDAATTCPMDQVDPKNLPNFESYIVEEEEGSGGYGIVYKARRKTDGMTVAIKCPHAKAHRNHVSNELRMLERFGGKNFIIKYEGCIKNENSDCFVLEHVEHDRPEFLKKEIDVFQLRWYGYCLFRALATLHKQGIVHRDVKPGNFLFSRKANKGYLIDFNLAMDLHQKYGANKLKAGNGVNFNNVTLPSYKSVPATKSRRTVSAKPVQTFNKEIKVLKSSLEPKSMTKKGVERAKIHKDLGGLKVGKSQGPEGSGVTSLKDATSTKTSAERLREPLPCQGRKELINLLQEAMQSPNHEASSVPMRKRIAAPLGRLDGKLIYVTPMPVHATGNAITGNGKGDGKQKKEGPCVGTKGFRAPEKLDNVGTVLVIETGKDFTGSLDTLLLDRSKIGSYVVLFRSFHQGPKLDVWSAGVTLLYLMIGRTPFGGDPDQNIKDIAKLRGSEDLWEVSKLHDQEASFPLDLYNTQSLQPMTLQDWCKMNTRRQHFLDLIPSSLIDLVDKCLTVNPRVRISAEEALKHEFFTPCHESLRKQRLLRQGSSLESGTASSLLEQTMKKPVRSHPLQP